MIHMFTHHDETGARWRFAVVDHYAEGKPGSVLLQRDRRTDNDRPPDWETLAVVANEPSDVPGVVWGDRTVSFTGESIARLAATVDEYKRIAAGVSQRMAQREHVEFFDSVIYVCACGAEVVGNKVCADCRRGAAPPPLAPGDLVWVRRGEHANRRGVVVELTAQLRAFDVVMRSDTDLARQLRRQYEIPDGSRAVRLDAEDGEAGRGGLGGTEVVIPVADLGRAVRR